MRRDSLDACVVLWHGQYCNDGRERLDTLRQHERSLFGLRNPRLVGRAGNWRLIADTSLYEPHHADVEAEPHPKGQR